MPLASLCLALLTLADPTPVALTRKFTKGEKLAYGVTSHITVEVRERGLQTFIPEDLDINYDFNYTVQSLVADGFATLKFQQPSTTEIEGETSTSGPKAKTDKSDKVFLYTVSPINDVADIKDVTPKKPLGKKPKGKGKGESIHLLLPGGRPQAPIFGEYISEMHRLALFYGMLSFAPQLPLEPVKVGDTWKKTAGYQPQKLKGKDGKSAVQRLDYTYTYLGPMTVDGKKILRVQAKLDLNTDLADYLKSLMEGSDMETNIKTMPLHMKASIDFDLDPTTRHTLAAIATSEGGFELLLTNEEGAYYEEKFKGRTNLRLAGRKIMPVGK